MAVNNRGYWPYRVEAGDILTNGRTFRVVRHATQGKSGLTTGVALAIQRCSWTTRGFTALGYVDLKLRNFRPTGLRITLDSLFDLALLADIVGLPDRSQQRVCCTAALGAA